MAPKAVPRSGLAAAARCCTARGRRRGNALLLLPGRRGGAHAVEPVLHRSCAAPAACGVRAVGARINGARLRAAARRSAFAPPSCCVAAPHTPPTIRPCRLRSRACLATPADQPGPRRPHPARGPLSAQPLEGPGLCGRRPLLQRHWHQEGGAGLLGAGCGRRLPGRWQSARQAQRAVAIARQRTHCCLHAAAAAPVLNCRRSTAA